LFELILSKKVFQTLVKWLVDFTYEMEMIIIFTIETPRLGFIPMTAESLEAAARGEKELQFFLGIKVAEGLIEPIHKERVFPIRMEKLRRNPDCSKWYGFVVEREKNTVIGMMGYKTPPNDNGLIEIGYGIHSQFQGKGYASEMVKGLIEWAYQQEDVKGITATNILKNNFASIKMVEKMGMVLLHENKDTVDYIMYK
jgi:[ribosomal protein S5]-alanine N-acetyltransferase